MREGEAIEEGIDVTTVKDESCCLFMFLVPHRWRSSKGAARTRVVSLMICVFYDSTVQSSTVVGSSLVDRIGMREMLM